MDDMKKKDHGISNPGNNLRVLEDLGLRSPSGNISLEEAIQEAVSSGESPPTVRYWRNRRSAIIGRSQEAGVEIDLWNCKKSEIPVIRRNTGGGTVLHHPNNLNYSIYLPEPSSMSVEKETRRMSNPVASALSEFGFDIRVQSNGLFVGGRKLGGTAQSRRGGFLHHGTILVNDDEVMENMIAFLRAGRDGYGEVVSRVASKPDQVTNLNSLVKRRISLPDLVNSLTDKLAEALDRVPVKGRISGAEWRVASYLGKTKYSSPAWNFKFSDAAEKREAITEKGNGGAGWKK